MENSDGIKIRSVRTTHDDVEFFKKSEFRKIMEALIADVYIDIINSQTVLGENWDFKKVKDRVRHKLNIEVKDPGSKLFGYEIKDNVINTLSCFLLGLKDNIYSKDFNQTRESFLNQLENMAVTGKTPKALKKYKAPILQGKKVNIKLTSSKKSRVEFFKKGGTGKGFLKALKGKAFKLRLPY